MISKKMKTRAQIQIRGIVQGVGFRPFVFALAKKNALKGEVLNNATGVLVDVEGENEKIESFICELRANPPPLSVIESVSRHDISKKANFQTFEILASETSGERNVPVSADIATCADCLRELFDPNDRRYRYPFINCTNCGPRFTIIENVPYDRARTTMRDFEMCEECRAEYENPLDRRFHAEPTCCPQCGPQVFLSPPPAAADEPNQSVPPAVAGGYSLHGQGDAKADKDAISEARKLLENGKILAVKGLGGYHLACDALNEEAVKTLRARKYREDKPFALMANSVEVIEKYCFVSEAEKALLLSKERPIVLLKRKQEVKLPGGIAPKMDTLGFMLPYTPLHFLLLENSEKPLVMTSGNISDEPICFEDNEAVERLKNIADFYLTHNRRIHIRTDDSVVRVLENGKRKTENNRSAITDPRSQIVLRRSRGFAPAPLTTSFKFQKQILACGAELKNTFCLAKDDHAFLSHHIGDLENLETLRSFTEGIEHFKRLFDLQPEIIAHDLHPEYLSTKYALEQSGEKIGVQHHHAHIASCLANNSAEGEVIGVAMDGTGFGLDGRIWGGEFLIADLRSAERVAHLEYVPLPGGAKAIREPWRMAAVYLQKTFGDKFLELDLSFTANLDRAKWKTLESMIRSGTNCPETSSMGRLFDAIAGILSLRNSVNYEGQAAIELEMLAHKEVKKGYRFETAENGIIKTEQVIREAVEDLLNKRPATEVSAKFHLAVAELISDLARQVRKERNLNRVALSGGVFQNVFLLETACHLLRKEGFEVLTHSRVPANDGGISLGQATVANALCQ